MTYRAAQEAERSVWSRDEPLEKADRVIHSGQGRHLGCKATSLVAVGGIGQDLAQAVPDHLGPALVGTNPAPETEGLDPLRGVRLVPADRDDDERDAERQRLLRAVEAAVGDEGRCFLEQRDLGDVSLDPDVRRRGAKSCPVLVATDRRHDLDRLSRHCLQDRLEHAGFRMRDRPEARDDQRPITGLVEPGRTQLQARPRVHISDEVGGRREDRVAVPARRREGQMQVPIHHQRRRIRLHPQPPTPAIEDVRDDLAAVVEAAPRAGRDRGVRQTHPLGGQAAGELARFADDDVGVPRRDVALEIGKHRLNGASREDDPVRPAPAVRI